MYIRLELTNLCQTYATAYMRFEKWVSGPQIPDFENDKYSTYSGSLTSYLSESLKVVLIRPGLTNLRAFKFTPSPTNIDQNDPKLWSTLKFLSKSIYLRRNKISVSLLGAGREGEYEQ